MGTDKVIFVGEKWGATGSHDVTYCSQLPVKRSHLSTPSATGSHGTCTTTLVAIQNLPVAHAHTITFGN
jgi:hypothetical protein